MVSLGLADGVLTAKPVITFWRHVIKRYTNFALEAHDLDFNQGSAQFNSTPSCNLDRIGDLVYWMYVRIDLPGIGLQFDDRIVNSTDDVDPATGISAEPYWTHAVGQALVDRANFFIGGQCIDEIFSEMGYIWEELSGSPGKRLQEMTGKFDSITALQIVSRQPRTLYVPLFFWFTLNSGLALPLVSLQFHSVKVSVKFKQYQQLLKLTCYSQAAPYNFTLSSIEERPAYNPGNYNPATVQPASDLTTLTNSSMSAQMLVTYVYLDQNERAKFAEGAFESVIPQHQTFTQTVDQTVSTQYATGTDKTQRFELTFNHTVMELFWVVRLGVHEDVTETTPCTNLNNEWFNFSGPDDIVTGLPIDPVVKCRLLLNNANRWEEREGRYFRLVQPYQHHTNIPARFIYCYSFALQPQDIQPSGTCNFSRIDSTTLELTLDGRLFYGPSTQSGTDGNSNVKVFIFARNWNVLRFKYGLGGLRFANVGTTYGKFGSTDVELKW
jgi:hypothetical protein